MSALLDIIAQVQTLNLPPGSPTALVLDQMLDAILMAEGPPSQPIEDFSEGLRTAIARSPTGRPLFLGHTWSTSPWTCLLIDLPPTPMGRPVFIRNPQTGIGRISLDYRSQKFQKRLVAACLALQIPPPPVPSRLCVQVDSHRLFVAWTAHNDPVPKIDHEGDLDNYSKNVLDALQRSRLIQNDRTVASFTAAKSIIPSAVRSLDDVLMDSIRDNLLAHPKASAKTLASSVGLSVRRTKLLLKQIKAQDAEHLASVNGQEEVSTQVQAGNPVTGSAPASLTPTDQLPAAHTSQTLDPILA